MTAELGATAQATGLVAAVLAVWAWSRVARGASPALARRATALMLAGALGAFAALEAALLRHDFSVTFVAENGGRRVPLYYTVTSLWSALAGSLLLWLVVLCGYAVVLAWRVPAVAATLHPVAMSVVCTVAAAFFALALFAGNAFARVSPVPADGPGPNPLLRNHPAMGVHPPLLYLGFVGMLVPFAYAAAALLRGDTSNAWLVAARRWLLVGWAALTAGILLGAWWAYAVLGWGGYWGWDPVENSSVLPWLTATALLHSTMVQRRRPTLRLWNLALAGATFQLVLVGTFLTRSGVVASVHSFTQSAIGPALLVVVVGSVAAFTGLLVWRADRLRPEQPVGERLSRGTVFLGNNLLLVCLAFTILLGTVFPLLAEALTGQQLSVGAPYFNRMAPPLALAVLLLMAVGPLVRWRGDEPGDVLRRLRWPAAAGLLTIAVLGTVGVRGRLALLTCGLGVLVLASILNLLGDEAARARRATGAGPGRTLVRVLRRRRRRYGGMLVHAGVAVAAVSIAGSAAWTASVERPVRVGDRLSVSGVTMTVAQLSRARHGDVMSTQARLVGPAGTLVPSLNFYPNRSVLATSPAISSSPLRDVYATLVQISADGKIATVRLAVNPLVPWLWAAGAVMVLGSLIAAWPERRAERGSAATPAERQPRVPAEASL